MSKKLLVLLIPFLLAGCGENFNQNQNSKDNSNNQEEQHQTEEGSNNEQTGDGEKTQDDDGKIKNKEEAFKVIETALDNFKNYFGKMTTKLTETVEYEDVGQFTNFQATTELTLDFVNKKSASTSYVEMYNKQKSNNNEQFRVFLNKEKMYYLDEESHIQYKESVDYTGLHPLDGRTDNDHYDSDSNYCKRVGYNFDDELLDLHNDFCEGNHEDLECMFGLENFTDVEKAAAHFNEIAKDKNQSVFVDIEFSENDCIFIYNKVLGEDNIENAKFYFKNKVFTGYEIKSPQDSDGIHNILKQTRTFIFDSFDEDLFNSIVPQGEYYEDKKSVSPYDDPNYMGAVRLYYIPVIGEVEYTGHYIWENSYEDASAIDFVWKSYRIYVYKENGDYLPNTISIESDYYFDEACTERVDITKFSSSHDFYYFLSDKKLYVKLDPPENCALIFYYKEKFEKKEDYFVFTTHSYQDYSYIPKDSGSFKAYLFENSNSISFKVEDDSEIYLNGEIVNGSYTLEKGKTYIMKEVIQEKHDSIYHFDYVSSRY